MKSSAGQRLPDQSQGMLQMTLCKTRFSKSEFDVIVLVEHLGLEVWKFLLESKYLVCSNI